MPEDTEARRQLDGARRARKLGDVELCLELAQAAHFYALRSEDGECAYHAHAAVGRLRYWRAEYEEAYTSHREALRFAETFGLRHWITAAHHDCWLAGIGAGWPVEDTKHQAVSRVDSWRCEPDRLHAFIHDLATSRNDGSPDRAKFLHQAAISSLWSTVPPTANGADWYPSYLARFDRMVVCANLVGAVGALVGDLGPVMLSRAYNLFQMAADELGSEEGLGLCLLEVARGLHAGGRPLDVRDVLARAQRVSQRRREARIGEGVAELAERWGV